MDSLEYEVLSNLEAGGSMFRSRHLSGEAQQAFVELMGLLLRLRREGFRRVPGRADLQDCTGLLPGGRACGPSRGGADCARARATSRRAARENLRSTLAAGLAASPRDCRGPPAEASRNFP
jgi:hypothetical protein